MGSVSKAVDDLAGNVREDQMFGISPWTIFIFADRGLAEGSGHHFGLYGEGCDLVIYQLLSVLAYKQNTGHQHSEGKNIDRQDTPRDGGQFTRF